MNAGRLDSFPVLSRIVFQNIVKDRGHDASGRGPYGFAETHQSSRGERVEFDGESDGEIVRIVCHGGYRRRGFRSPSPAAGDNFPEIIFSGRGGPFGAGPWSASRYRPAIRC